MSDTLSPVTTQPFLAEPGNVHHHLEFDLTDSWAEFVRALPAAWPDDPALPRVNVVIGFRPSLWPLTTCAPVADMTAIASTDGAHVAPATQHDAWVWVHGASEHGVAAAVSHICDALQGVATVVESNACLAFEENRTVEGFVDGTENPNQFEAAAAAVRDGMSTALVQRWESTGKSEFLALPIADQERVIGRTKAASVELEDLPIDSHVARNVLEVNGEELPILRRNLPLADASGYMFAGFCQDPTVTLRMLERMYGHGEPAVRDRITDFVTARTGSMYVVPSVEQLQDVGALPESD